MFRTRAVGAAGWALLIVAVGGLMAGCAQQQRNATPKASAMGGEPPSAQTAAQLYQSLRASYPGSQVGVVNAVLPARRLISVSGLPLDQVHRGDVVTIMQGPGNNTLEAVVYAKGKYVQLTYQPLGLGQRDPAVWDAAIWYPNGATVSPAALEPANAPDIGAAAATPPPATQPAVEGTNASAARQTIPPTTQPASAAELAAPTTQPAGGAAATAAPAVTQTPSSPAPATQPAAEINK